MTIEELARRVGGSLAFGGLGLILAAVVSWATIGDGGQIPHSIHTVTGWVLAFLGVVMIGSGLWISSPVRSQVDQEQPPSMPETASS